MFEFNKDIINNVILKARGFHAKESERISENNSDVVSNDILRMLANHREVPIYREFMELVNDLEPDQQEEVIALMYFG